jgi:hypothetical protein
MKHSVDGRRHQVNRGLNSLARQIVEEEFSREMIKKEIEEQFHYVSFQERSSLVSEVISRSYRYAWAMPGTAARARGKSTVDAVMPREEFESHEGAVQDCFAFRIARHLMGVLKKRPAGIDNDGCLDDGFYSDCLRSLARTDLAREIGDRELLEIYLRQAGTILKKTSLARRAGNRLSVEADRVSVFDLYSELFLSFWERVEWDDIFPSSPTASRELMKCRNILIDLIAREKKKFRVDAIANEFFSLTGFGEPNDLFLISFLDFYFFTWMAHFGILGYCRKGRAVCMELTPYGRSFLARLRNRA